MRGFISIVPFVLAAAVLSNSTPALGELVIVEVTGVVDAFGTSPGFALDGSVSVGSVMTGAFTYESDAAPIGYTTYPLISLTMNIGNYTFTHNPSSQPQSQAKFQIASGISFYYEVHSRDPRFEGIMYSNGLPITYDDTDWSTFDLTLMYLGGQGTVGLPGTLPDPSGFPDLSIFNIDNWFHAQTNEPGDGFGIQGRITSLKAIPEPATVLLFALGSVWFLRKDRAGK